MTYPRSTLPEALPVPPGPDTTVVIKVVPGLPRYWTLPNEEPLAVWLSHVALDGGSRRSARRVLAALDRVARAEGYRNGAAILGTALEHPYTPLAVEYRPRVGARFTYWRGERYKIINGKLVTPDRRAA